MKLGTPAVEVAGSHSEVAERLCHKGVARDASDIEAAKVFGMILGIAHMLRSHLRSSECRRVLDGIEGA